MNMALLSRIVGATLTAGFIVLSRSEEGLGELVNAGHAECNDAAPGVTEGSTGVRATNQGIQFHQSQNAQQGFGSQGFGGTQADQGAQGFAPQGNAPQGNAPVADTSAPTNGTPAFVRVSDFTPPAKGAETRKREQPEKYPFGELKAPVANPAKPSGFDYDAIFVPSSKYGPKHEKAGQLRSPDDMAFSLQSACSAAERRYATVTGETKNAKGKVSKVYNKEREFKTVGGTDGNGAPGAYIYRAK